MRVTIGGVEWVMCDGSFGSYDVGLRRNCASAAATPKDASPGLESCTRGWSCAQASRTCRAIPVSVSILTRCRKSPPTEPYQPCIRQQRSGISCRTATYVTNVVFKLHLITTSRRRPRNHFSIRLSDFSLRVSSYQKFGSHFEACEINERGNLPFVVGMAIVHYVVI